MTLDASLLRPWRLPPNRVSRFYSGGLLLDAFRGEAHPVDSTHPEDWVGSGTPSWTPPGTAPTEEGLGDAEIDGTRYRIADLLARDPGALVGAELVAAVGQTPGVLVKLLDAGVRLPVHAHPDRAFARSRLGSYFGKAEAWIVTDTRDAGDPLGPGVWLGFRRDVDRDELMGWIARQDTEALLGAMRRRPTAAGDAWFVPPGTPHAIGAGLFIIEVQEPTDFSIVAETRDIPIAAADAHLRLGWEVAADALDRSGHDDRWVDGLRRRAASADPAEGGLAGVGVAESTPRWQRRDLLDERAAPYFRAELLTLDRGTARPWDEPGWLVGVVTGGSGRVATRRGGLDIRRGDTFAIPAAVLTETVIESEIGVELVACRPPDPSALDRWRP